MGVWVVPYHPCCTQVVPEGIIQLTVYAVDVPDYDVTNSVCFGEVCLLGMHLFQPFFYLSWLAQFLDLGTDPGYMVFLDLCVNVCGNVCPFVIKRKSR